MRSRSLSAPPCCPAAAATGIIASASAASPRAVATCAASLGAAGSAAVSTSIKSSAALGSALGRSAAGSATALEAALEPVPVASTPSKAACSLENRCMMAACRSLASCLRRSTSF